MSQAEELLDSLDEEMTVAYTAAAESEPHIVINSDRTITVPPELKHIAVQFDHNIETVTFDCPRYWDAHDFSTMKVYIVYRRKDGYKDRYPADNITVDKTDESIIHFEWTISKNVTLVKGNISFIICINSTDDTGVETNHWNSRLNQDLVVDEGLECSADEIVEQNPDAIESVLIRLDAVERNSVNPDYEQNDVTAPDYIKNRPFYTETDGTVHTLDDKYIPDSIARSEEVNVVDKKVDTLREVVSKFHSNIVEEAKGNIITLDDAFDMELAGLKVYGKTTQNGTPTPEAPVTLESVGDGGSVTIKIGITEADENPQTLTIQKPDELGARAFLPGIPDSVYGNYTDENGQRWSCDVVDFEGGVYLKRITQHILNGDEVWKGLNSSTRSFCTIIGANGLYRSLCLCDKLPYAEVDDGNNVIGIRVVNSTERGGDHIYLRIPEEYAGVTSVAAFTQWLADHPLTVYVIRKEPIEIPLSAEQLAQYAALHTNYPNTTIYNDGGADMEVKYVADTKLYIDKKFAEEVRSGALMTDRTTGKKYVVYIDNGKLTMAESEG